MDVLSLISVAFGGALIVQLIAFAYSIKADRVDIVDVAWGLSFVAGVALLQIVQPSTTFSVLLVDSLVLVWGLRLAWHIYRRFKRSSQQDARYTNLIARWPKRLVALQLFTRIFLLQAILATLIILPVVAVHVGQPSLGLIIFAGFAVWCIGFIFESLADSQLKKFLAQPDHDELMMSGLWKYSRHPNYFGEVTMWWGIAIIATATPFWWLGIIGATTISILIGLVSGVPLAEKQAARKKGWLEYKSRTNLLIPFPPKK